MPWEYHYETNCCGHEKVHTKPTLLVGQDYRGQCPECRWITTWTCVESYVVDKWGHVL